MKPVKRLKLYVPGDPDKRWWWVLVFASKQEMWDYRDHYARKTGQQEPRGGFGAMVCPWSMIRIGPDGSEVVCPSIGMVLLNKRALGCGLISHEMVHCAMHVYRLRHQHATFDADGCGSDEEELADLVGELTRHIVDKLYAHKLVGV